MNGETVGGDGQPSATDPVRALIELGLPLNEAKLYVELLRHPHTTAAELAQRSRVPKSKVYATLASLEQRGFCSSGGDRVRVYQAVGPELALDEWVRRREHEREMATTNDRRLAGDLARVLPAEVERESGLEGGFMETMIGWERAFQLFEEMVSSARHRMDIVHSPPVLQPRQRWNALEAQALARGARVRVLYSPEILDLGPERYRGLLAAGGEARISSAMPLKIVIRDSVEAIVALRTPAPDERVTSVHIQHRDLVSPIQLMFQREWRHGRRLDDLLDDEGNLGAEFARIRADVARRRGSVGDPNAPLVWEGQPDDS